MEKSAAGQNHHPCSSILSILLGGEAKNKCFAFLALHCNLEFLQGHKECKQVIGISSRARRERIRFETKENRGIPNLGMGAIKKRDMRFNEGGKAATLFEYNLI